MKVYGTPSLHAYDNVKIECETSELLSYPVNTGLRPLLAITGSSISGSEDINSEVLYSEPDFNIVKCIR